MGKLSPLLSIVVVFVVVAAADFRQQQKSSLIIRAERLHHLPNPFIIGETVKGREFPGQISLQVNEQHLCGGSIVNANYILTAAHCSQYQPSELSVLSGANELNVGGNRHKVVDIQAHEGYDPYDSWHNDVAVMKVDPPFAFDDVTSPVNLPDPGQETPAGSLATVIGWGVSALAERHVDYLRKVKLYISDHEACENIYDRIGFTVYPEQICGNTPEGGKGFCFGDSGGPLFVNGSVVGLVSWASGCAEKGYPIVYTEVADYVEWILSKVTV